MASVIPKFVKKEIVDAWIGESLYLMLLNNLYAPDAGHQYAGQSEILSRRLSANGAYPAEGVLLSGKVQGYDDNNAFLDASNISIGPATTINYRYGVVYALKGASLSTSPIRCIIDFGSDQIITNGTTVIEWNALGIIYVT